MTPAFLHNPQQSVPRYAIVILLLVYGIVWTLALGGTALVPPMDNIEQLVWVRKLQWGYYKHPPLPTALLWPWVQLFGVQVSTTYILGAAITLLSLGWLWGWLRSVTDSRFATLALLAVLCITFYAGRLYYYNHNVTLLWGTVGATVCVWHAMRSGQLRWWLALGLVLGVSALGKYQIGLSVLSLLVYALWSGKWRQRSTIVGLFLAGAVSLAVFAPHAWWALEQRSNPLNYARSTSLQADFGWWQSIVYSLRWLADQFLNRGLLAWVLLGFAVWRWRKSVKTSRTSDRAPAQSAPQPTPHATDLRRFLICFGLLPFGVMLLMGLAGGVDLQLHWGTAYLPLAVPAVMLLWRTVDWSAILGAPAWKCFLILQALLLTQIVVTSGYGIARWRSSNWRTFDAQRVANAVGEPARAALQGTVRVIIGGKEAGAIAMYLPERPLVLLGGNPHWSPWVPPDMVARCGAIRIDVDHSRITWRTQRSASEEQAANALEGVEGGAAQPPVASASAPNMPASATKTDEKGMGGVIENPGSTIAAVRWSLVPREQGAAPCPAP